MKTHPGFDGASLMLVTALAPKIGYDTPQGCKSAHAREQP